MRDWRPRPALSRQTKPESHSSESFPSTWCSPCVGPAAESPRCVLLSCDDARTPSVNPARGRLNHDELLTRLGLAPQSEGRPQEPQLLRDAVVLDQLLDSGKPFGRVDAIVHHAR